MDKLSDDQAGIAEARGTILYPENIERFAGPRTRIAETDTPIGQLGARHLLARALDELAGATREFAEASLALAEATGREQNARINLEQHEAAFRVAAYGAGITGTNEAQRNANLAAAMIADDDLSDQRATVDDRRIERLVAEHTFRTADQRQKALRAQIDGYRALISN